MQLIFLIPVDTGFVTLVVSRPAADATAEKARVVKSEFPQSLTPATVVSPVIH